MTILTKPTCFDENDIVKLDKPILIGDCFLIDSYYEINEFEELKKLEEEEKSINNFKAILKDAIESNTIVEGSIKEEYSGGDDYLKRNVEFSYYTKVGKSISQTYKEYQDQILDQNKNNQEETKEMNMCEFELGMVFLIKDAVDDIFDGEGVLVCPSYAVGDFIVNQGEGCINVIATGDICCDCGEPEVYEFNFDLNPNYKVKDLKYNVRDGLFILMVDYDMDNSINIRLDNTL